MKKWKDENVRCVPDCVYVLNTQPPNKFEYIVLNVDANEMPFALPIILLNEE